MKRTILALVTSALIATPALAQWHRDPRSGQMNGADFWRGAPDNPYQRIQFMQDRVNRGVADGSIDRREAWRVNRQLNGVRQWIQRMHWQGQRLTPDQRARVQARLDEISRQIRWMRHNDR
jgi:uncharacterized protein YdeI (BOF family)